MKETTPSVWSLLHHASSVVALVLKGRPRAPFRIPWRFRKGRDGSSERMRCRRRQDRCKQDGAYGARALPRHRIVGNMVVMPSSPSRSETLQSALPSRVTCSRLSSHEAFQQMTVSSPRGNRVSDRMRTRSLTAESQLQSSSRHALGVRRDFDVRPRWRRGDLSSSSTIIQPRGAGMRF